MEMGVYLSLVGAGAAVQMKKTVTVGTQVSTHITQDDGCSLTIVMIVTHRLWRGKKKKRDWRVF